MFTGESQNGGNLNKSTAERVGASRAEFSRQVNGFVEAGQHEHALDLIKYAKIEQFVKQGIDDEKELKETDEVWDEVQFLNELKSHVIKSLQEKRKNRLAA